MKTQGVIDEIFVSNLDAIKRLNKELLNAHEANANKNSEKAKEFPIWKDTMRNHNKRKCRNYKKGKKYWDWCKFNHLEHMRQVY